MCAAFERADIEAGAREHPARHLDMRGLAAVGRAGERNLLIAEAVALRRAAFEERQRLQGLHRRARIDRPRHVTKRQHGRAIGIRDGDGPAMAAFDEPTAHHLDKNRITHF